VSGDIGNANGSGLALYPDDRSHCDEAWFSNDELFQPDPMVSIRMRNDPADFISGGSSWRTPWWPASGFLQPGESFTLERPARWGDIWGASGCSSRFAIVGITRDQFGSPLGGCTVKMFRTSDDVLMSQVLSDANGAYTLTTPYYPDGHYIVIYKAGSPDVFGTTVNTLIAG